MDLDHVDALANAFNLGYAMGRADEEAYSLHCGDTDEPMTNGDAIRAMTDEELAKLIVDDWCELINCESVFSCNGIGVCNGDCEERILKWLKGEVKDGN